MVNTTCQREQTMKYPTIWSNIILVTSLNVFTEIISFQTNWLSKVIAYLEVSRSHPTSQRPEGEKALLLNKKNISCLGVWTQASLFLHPIVAKDSSSFVPSPLTFQTDYVPPAALTLGLWTDWNFAIDSTGSEACWQSVLSLSSEIMSQCLHTYTNTNTEREREHKHTYVLLALFLWRSPTDLQILVLRVTLKEFKTLFPKLVLGF